MYLPTRLASFLVLARTRCVFLIITFSRAFLYYLGVGERPIPSKGFALSSDDELMIQRGLGSDRLLQDHQIQGSIPGRGGLFRHLDVSDRPQRQY